MANKAYTWDETQREERKAQPILDAICARENIIVRALRAHQKQGIDCFHICRTDGTVLYAVDYKADSWAKRTGNLPIEDVSVRRNGRVLAKGWAVTTKSKYVIFYVADMDMAFKLSVERIREKWQEITHFEHKSTSTKYRDYETEFYCVPISWLKNNGIIERDYAAIGAQYRLPLKSGRN